MGFYDFDFIEWILLLVSGILTVRFLLRWYRFGFGVRKIKSGISGRTLLRLLPVCALIIILYTLNTLASFDVVDSFAYKLLYALIGVAWLNLGMFLMFYLLDISWIDDALNMHNPAAALTIFGGGMGLTLIYAGANVGDGPGWWCVFLAGGLGLIAYFALCMIANSITKAFRRITVDRDVLCAVRTGAYTASSGIILARACAGDWTSFSMTVIEFGVGWPALILTAAFVLFEVMFSAFEKREEHIGNAEKWFLTLLLGAAYITAAIYVVYMLPSLFVYL